MKKYIETERLILKPLVVEDAPAVFKWTGDPEVNKYMAYPLYHELSAVENWIRGITDDANEFGFFLKDTGELIGSGGVGPNEKGNAYEVGYNLNRNYWGKGYATEAAKAMIAWAHTELGITSFTIGHVTANTASGNVIRKCGFVFDHAGTYDKFDGSQTFEARFYTLELK